MDSAPFTMSVLINKETYAHTLFDTGCLSYGMITSRFARKHNLQHMKINPHTVTGFDGPSDSSVDEVAIVQIDIDGHKESRAFFYIVPKIASYDLIVGLPWMKQNKVIMDAGNASLTIGTTGTYVRNRAVTAKDDFNHLMVSATSFTNLVRKKEKKKQGEIEVFLASMADIEKALSSKKRSDPQTKLPGHYHDFLDVFDRTMAEKLPSLRGEGTDHRIKLHVYLVDFRLILAGCDLSAFSRLNQLYPKRSLDELGSNSSTKGIYKHLISHGYEAYGTWKHCALPHDMCCSDGLRYPPSNLHHPPPNPPEFAPS